MFVNEYNVKNNDINDESESVMIVVKMIMKTPVTCKRDILHRENDHNRQLDGRRWQINKRYAIDEQYYSHVAGVDRAGKCGDKKKKKRKKRKKEEEYSETCSVRE